MAPQYAWVESVFKVGRFKLSELLKKWYETNDPAVIGSRASAISAASACETRQTRWTQTTGRRNLPTGRWGAKKQHIGSTRRNLQ